MMKKSIFAVILLALVAPVAFAQSRVAEADSTTNTLSQHIIGNKEDTAVTTSGTTASLMGYLKGLVSMTKPVEATGTCDLDISEYDYTDVEGVTTLTISPTTGNCLTDCSIALDFNKATTGFDAVATAADTITARLCMNVDGTNTRWVQAGTAATATGSGTRDSGQYFHVGPVGVDGKAIIRVYVSAERGDVEIPYRVIYRGPTPAITAVAAE